MGTVENLTSPAFAFASSGSGLRLKRGPRTPNNLRCLILIVGPSSTSSIAWRSHAPCTPLSSTFAILSGKLFNLWSPLTPRTGGSEQKLGTVPWGMKTPNISICAPLLASRKIKLRWFPRLTAPLSTPTATKLFYSLPTTNPCWALPSPAPSLSTFVLWSALLLSYLLNPPSLLDLSERIDEVN